MLCHIYNGNNCRVCGTENVLQLEFSDMFLCIANTDCIIIHSFVYENTD